MKDERDPPLAPPEAEDIHTSDDPPLAPPEAEDIHTSDYHLKNILSNNKYIDGIYKTIATDLDRKSEAKRKLKDDFYKRTMRLFFWTVVVSIIVILLSIILKITYFN